MVFLTFVSKDVRLMRILAIFSNIAFLTYSSLAWLPPVFCLHLILLPINTLRLREILYPDSLKSQEKFLAFRVLVDSDGGMIRGGFLSAQDRKTLIALARDGSAASRLTRRANALVLLDDGWSCQEVANALLLNDDTIRNWHKLFEQRGMEGPTSFDMGGSASFLTAAQEDALKAFVGATLPRSTRQVGAFIAREFGLVYESRSGLIALLHRLGLEYHKPDVVARKLDVAKQKDFIEGYDKLSNFLGDDEAALFVDAVHPTHPARPVGCWAPK
jgi:transposase